MVVAVEPHELWRSLVIYDGRVGLRSDLILPSLLHRTAHNVKQDLHDPCSEIFQFILCWLENKHSAIGYVCCC